MLKDYNKLRSYISEPVEDVIFSQTDTPVLVPLEIINGRKYKSYQFKPGNQLGKNNKDKKKGVTAIAKFNRIEDSREFKQWVKTYGLTRVRAIMETMNDMDFIRTFVFIAPYCLPKIASVEQRSEDKIQSIDREQVTHTVTVRDMRSGHSYQILDK